MVATVTVGKLVARWQTISRLYGAPDAIRDAIYQQCADELKIALRQEGQAGVSALSAAVQAVIDSYKEDGPGYPPTFGRPKIRAAWNNLNSALATAPPEQAQCCCNVSWLDLDISDCPIHGPKAKQPQAVSAGVLRSDNEYVHAFQLANRVLERINADPDDDLAVLARQFLRANERAIAEHNALAAHDQVTAKAHILNLKELPSKSDEERAEDFMDCNYDSHDDCVKWLAANFADVRRIALAAHDQKVRDQLAAWMIVNSFATGHGDTVEDLLKELKWQIEELRARPAPAASKPEAAKEKP